MISSVLSFIVLDDDEFQPISAMTTAVNESTLMNPDVANVANILCEDT